MKKYDLLLQLLPVPFNLAGSTLVFNQSHSGTSLLGLILLSIGCVILGIRLGIIFKTKHPTTF
jgi:hypothetical protein